jgi:hypothetical protein
MCRVQVLIFVLLVFFRGETASAFHFSGFDEGDKGIGLLLGSPLGLRYESWVDWKRAYLIDAGYGADRALIGSLSHLWSAYDVEDYWRNSGLFNSLIFSYGLGAFFGYRLDTGDKTPVQAGIKGLVGFQHMFGRGNFSLRVEVGPALAVVGDTAVSVQGSIGLIYYFGGPIQARANAKADDTTAGSSESEKATAKHENAKNSDKPKKSGKTKKSKSKKAAPDDDGFDDEFD